jgi:hypothetical protein
MNEPQARVWCTGNMPTRRIALLLTTSLALAACGGGDDAPSGAATTTEPSAPTTAPSATTAPATTAPAATTTAPPPTTAPAPTTAPPTTEPTAAEPVLGDPVMAENAFLTVRPIEGWQVINLLDEPQRTYEDSEGLGWEASPDSLVELVALASPDGLAQLVIGREGRHLLAPGVFEWDSALAELLGVQPNIDVTTEWGGGEGESTRGRLGPAWIRHDSVRVGEHLLTVIALSETQPSDQYNAELDAMIASITVDPSALPPLTHALDTTVSTDVEEAGTTFSISVLTPPTWIQPADAVDVIWLDPNAPDDGPIPNIFHLAYVDDSPLAGFLDERLTEYQPLAQEPVIEDLGDVGGALALVAWDGPVDQADTALLVVADGVVSQMVIITVPGDPATLQEMVASVLVNDSALLP